MLTPNPDLGNFNFELIKKLNGGKSWLMTDSYGNKYVISTNELNKRGGSLGNKWNDSGISSIGEASQKNITEANTIVWSKSELTKMVYQDGKPYFSKPKVFASIEDLTTDINHYKNNDIYKDYKLIINETHSDGMSTGLFADEEDGYNIDTKNLEETKYVLKGSAPSTDSSMEDEMPLPDDVEMEDPLAGLDDMDAEGGDKPFDDEPFDAEVEADEDTDPEKYIQQLSGKLGQSLRQYTEDEGQPDFDLEKFAVNSVLSATHTGEMDKEDQRDIINKVKDSGNEDPEDMPVDGEEDIEEPIDNEVENEDNFDFGEEPVEEADSRFGKDERWGSGDKRWGDDDRWGAGLQESEKNRTFVDKDKIMEAAEPLVEPVTKPTVKPERKREIDRPFLPKRKDKVKVPPKAGEMMHEEGDSEGIEFNGSVVDVNTINIEGVKVNDYPDFVDAFIASASYVNGKPLTDDELVNFQGENDMLVNDIIFDKQLYASYDEDGGKYE